MESNLNQTGNELGDTLIANSIITGSIIFNARLQYLSEDHIDKVAIWSRAFVRQKAYLLTNEQRYASTKHGALCTLIDPANLIKSVVASWSYKLIARGDNLLFKPNWFDEYSIISEHLGFPSLDHMINYTNRDWEKA